MEQLETVRLTLRPLTADDLDRVIGLYGNAQVTEFTKLGQLTRAQARTTLEEHVQRWRDRGLGMRAAFLKAGGDFVGECGFFSLASRVEPALRYALLPPYWGSGLTTEAVRVTLDDCFARAEPERVWSVVQAPNTAARRVMEKLGFRLQEKVEEPKPTINFYVITAEEWRTREPTGPS